MNTKLAAFLINLMIIAFTMLAVHMAYLGYQYGETGYGINPLIAYPLATLFILAGLFAPRINVNIVWNFEASASAVTK